jgi:hypothetical protein
VAERPHNVVVRLIKHDESYEVRVSSYFYFDTINSRRAITKRPSQDEAVAEAMAFART